MWVADKNINDVLGGFINFWVVFLGGFLTFWVIFHYMDLILREARIRANVPIGYDSLLITSQ